MAIACDVFLVYDGSDDVTGSGETAGWVTQFRRGLELRLTALLGARPVVCGSCDANASSGVAVLMVHVLTRASIAARDCTAQRRQFFAQSPRPAQERVFNVRMQPISSSVELEELRDALSYEFFDAHSLQRLSPGGDPAMSRRYWLLLDDLAHALADAITAVRGAATPHASEQEARCVFLADTGDDLRDEHDNMRRELQRHGYVIVPSTPLASVTDDVGRIVRTELSRAALSVHLIGAHRGVVQRDGSQSLMELEHQLALEHCRNNPDFHHLIWIPLGVTSDDVRQQSFLHAIRRLNDVGAGTELVQSALEDFKTLVADKLRAESPRDMRVTNSAATMPGPTMYLMFDRQDTDAVTQLQAYVNAQGINVIPTEFDGDQPTLRKIHQDNLRTCDAALIVYGNVREPWVRIKQQDLLKAAGFGRASGMLAKAIYLGPALTETKRNFTAREVMIIKDFDRVSPSSLQPFIDRIYLSRGEAA